MTGPRVCLLQVVGAMELGHISSPGMLRKHARRASYVQGPAPGLEHIVGILMGQTLGQDRAARLTLLPETTQTPDKIQKTWPSKHWTSADEGGGVPARPQLTS